MDSITKKIKVEGKDEDQPTKDAKAKTEFIKVDPDLQEKLTKAFMTGRFLICISRLDKDGELEHTCSTRKFEKGDIAPSMDKWSDLLIKDLPR